ncbi:hypothetical protein AB6G53_03005 [Staphylococcus haemolyticus]|uniref:hypothetical protein n=1 Tax=Staphylococcus haemolyticus TaxID=1283 RepID=UPI0034DD9F73
MMLKYPTLATRLGVLTSKNLKTKVFSENSINNIEKSSYEVLKSLQFDTTKTGPVKGLVMGNVQSGKTANMAGLMAMAQTMVLITSLYYPE